jgi:hypothetical protein
VAAKILPWAIPAVIVVLFGLGFLRAGRQMSLEMLLRWPLIHGGLAAVGAAARREPTMGALRTLLEAGKPPLLDGAMGMELDRRGVLARCGANITDPEAVLSVHRDHLAAGSAAIMTNTLTMNRVSIESHGLGLEATPSG